MRSILTLYIGLVAGVLIASPLRAAYSDSELLAKGTQAWDSDECVKAAEFMFAYVQRDPPALQRDAQHREAVYKVLHWCETNTTIRGGYVEAKADGLNAVVARPVKPPVNLRAPNVAGNPQKRCNIYATIAVAQSQSNQVNSCAFSGSRWDSRPQYHQSWCLTAPADEVRGETSIRQAMLDQCAP